MRLFIPMLFFFILCSFLIHILFFTTPTPFSLSCLAFFLFFILSTFLFFIQCPSPYPPHPHTKHAAIAKKNFEKRNEKKKNQHHTQPCTPTHNASPSLLFCFFNQRVFNAYAWLCWVCICLARACSNQAAATHTNKQNKKKYTVVNALHGIHSTQKTSLGKAHTHTHTGMEGQRRARLLRRRCARWAKGGARVSEKD